MNPIYKKTLMILILFSMNCLIAGDGSNSFTEMFDNGSVNGKKSLTSISYTKDDIAIAKASLATLTTYNSRAAFNADAPDLPVEDFEGGDAVPGQVIGCGSPITSAPNNCFGLGLEPGLEVHALSETNIVALGAGIVPVNPSTWVGSDLFNDVTFLEFTNNDAYAVGLDIFDFFGSPNIVIEIYSANGLIGNSLALSGGFWGVISDEPITKVVLGVSNNVIVLDNVAFGNPIVDTDGDGLPDDEDSCPESNLADNVVIDGCDSGVSNALLADGCTISDLIEEIAANASNHGQFVSGVSHLLNWLKREGVISGREKGAIQRCAAHSSLSN